ncbi:uncharacterized protein [Nicotiana sylvestris]|uniref:uncharacterized protein n=1 Tax=Nicotiana sylvestris TaxID=4096 RepID=UPI00388C7807
MFASKTVASGALSKKLNKKLKANQAQDFDSNSDSESYKSASKGEGPGSSDSEKTQESPSKVSSSLTKNLETRFVLVGPIRDVELPKLRRSAGKKKPEKEKEREGACGEERENGKRVVDYSSTADLSVLAICGVEQENVEESGKNTQGDEPGSSTGETLADLLKKVGASYDPKKRRTPTPKALSAPKPSKKRKVSSPTTTKTSLPKGRATRSRVKQSESDLQKALAESKKKRMAKGKGKVAESLEAVEVEEMEQVYREEVPTVEVQTPKPKSPKLPPRSLPLGEEEEEEDKSNGEQDKLAMFGKRKILKGRLMKDLVESGMMRLVEALAAQGRKDMVLQMDGRLARNDIMANAEVKDGKVRSLLKGVQVTFDPEKLGEILDIPSEGFDDYTRQRWPCLGSLTTALEITRRFCDAEDVNEARVVQKINAIPNEPGSSKKTPINSKVMALVQECETKNAEIARLKARVAKVESERDALRNELTKENEKSDGILHNMCRHVIFDPPQDLLYISIKYLI